MTWRDWPVIRLFFSSFSKVPGPLLAKVSRFWKLYHLLRGDYGAAIKRLHDRHGPLVQIAPHEYSLSEKSLVYIPNLHRTSSIILPEYQHTLERSLRMANLYSAERHVDSCNESLFALIEKASDKGENIDMSELLTRYAYEIMLVCTVGERAGFLEDDKDGNHVDMSVLKKWKLYSILHGSYLRYHPFIASIVKRWRMSGASSVDLMLKLMPSKLCGVLGTTERSQKTEMKGGGDAELEACVALTLAAVDPTITLIMTALYHIYSKPELLEELRAEVVAAQLSARPTFKELILARPSMPKLYAVLLECARVHRPYVMGPEYRSFNGQVDGKQKIPPGSSITLEPTMVHLDPSRFGDDSNEFNPMRWLDAALAPELQRALLAFNIGDITNTEASQLLLASKMLTYFMSTWQALGLPVRLLEPINNHLITCKNFCTLTFKPSVLAAFFGGLLKIAPRKPALADTTVTDPPTTSAGDDSTKGSGKLNPSDKDENTAPSNTGTSDAQTSSAGGETTVSDAEIPPVTDTTTVSASEVPPNDNAPAASPDHAPATTTISPPDASSDDGTPVATASSNVKMVSPPVATTSTSRRGSGSSKASSHNAGDRTIVKLPAANQLATILGEADAKELLNGRFAPSLKNFVGAKPLYTKPIPDSYLRRLVHKALDETHGSRVIHINNPDTNIMAIGLHYSIPRGYGKSKQQSGQSNNSKRTQYNNNKTNNNKIGNKTNTNNTNREGSGNHSFNQGRNPAPRTTTDRPRPTGGLAAIWNNYAKAEGERTDHLTTTEGYAERQAKMAAQDAAIKATGTDAEALPRFKTTFIQTGAETVNGKLGGARKIVKVEEY